MIECYSLAEAHMEDSMSEASSDRDFLSTDSDKALDGTKMQEILIPVHGFVKLYPEEIAIVDHPAFQRLRRMRQLGFAHMVFPGGTHTRFEHAIGAVHVAQVIIKNVNGNYLRSRTAIVATDWQIASIDYPTERFIRLGALLHDIGHLPFGHTLEDELNHLPHHDGRERLSKIADIRFEDYELDREILPDHQKPRDGWSLEELVNALYTENINRLGLPAKPFDVLTLIVCKRPESKSALEEWNQLEQRLSGKLRLSVCRDIIGNTICADFLDYLFRDWHHLGKPLLEDKRLYQYMEVRAMKGAEQSEEARFVINVGAPPKIRHDALTDILDLLGSRYKLAETVLFHRTKLAIIALLDRCLLEIREVYRLADIQESEFLQAAENLLIEGADDSLPNILNELAKGGTGSGQKKVQEVVDAQRQAVKTAIAKGQSQEKDPRSLLAHMDHESVEDDSRSRGELENHMDFVRQLIKRLKDRCVYTLAYKVRISDFPGVHSPDNRLLDKVIKMYNIPVNRLHYLQGIEALCRLPQGSVAMYCPPDVTMNAKIAKVNLFIEGEITPFDDYDKNQGDAGLTHGALQAQIKRFYELWSAQVYIERTCWDKLSKLAKKNLRNALGEFFFQRQLDSDPEIVRRSVEASVQSVLEETARAARAGSEDPRIEKFKGFKFPSGLNFDV